MSETSESAGVRLIAAAREKQLRSPGARVGEGATSTADLCALAAACYALPPNVRAQVPPALRWLWWPWESEWSVTNDRLEHLVHAGALIAAAIDHELKSQGAAEPPR